MTRYSGKLLSVSKINLEEIKVLMQPKDTLRYRVYKYVKQSKKPLTLNEIHKAISPDSVRRVFERILSDLSNAKYITRYKCQCGCSYIYHP
jgi:hypothetical protein